MNWKHDIQLNDLDDDQTVEFTCRTCGAVFFRVVQELKKRDDLAFAWMDQVEQAHICLQRGCRGRVRIALYHNMKTSGFIAGLA